jgi:hypothetical protein
MKHAFVVSAAALAALLVSGSALAQDRGTTTQDRPSTGTSKDAPTAAPAEKPGIFSLPHSVTGSVVSVDKKANRVNVVDSKGKELTLVADADTAPEISRLKAGDQVKVTYKKSKDQMVATKIDMVGAGSTSKAK